jgi:hypothetical protein
MGMGAEEDESSTGRVWAAGFHHVMAHSCRARNLKHMNHLFLQFSNFFSGHGKLRILKQQIRGIFVFGSHKIKFGYIFVDNR